MTTNNWNRRDVLARMGVGPAASLLLPFVPLLSREAHAALPPTRLVLFITPNGTFWDELVKTGGGEKSFELGTILKPLEAFKSRLTIVEGCDLRPGNDGRPHSTTTAHARANHLLTGRDGSRDGYSNSGGGGVSVDQTIAESIGKSTPFRSIELGVFKKAPDPYSFQGLDRPRVAVSDPRRVFNDIFESGKVPTTPTLVTPGAAVDPSLRPGASRRRVLDVVREHLRKIESQATAEERIKFQAHLSAVESLKTRLDDLDARGAMSCSRAKAPAATVTDASVFRPTMYPTVLPLQLDLAVSAMACDLTRVVTFVGGSVGNVGLSVDWVGGSPFDMHDRVHAGDRSRIVPLETWYAERFRDLLRAMDAVKEANGTLLDNSLVVWLKPMSDGGHVPGGGRGRCGTSRCQSGWANIPIVMAGGASNRIRTGRYLNFSGGTPHQKWLVSLCHAMGLTDVTSFGDPRFGSGALPGLAV